MVERTDPYEAVTDDVIHQLDEVTAALEGLAECMRQEEDLGAILHRACLQAIHAIPEADTASVVLLRDNEPHTAAATDDVAAGADRAQYEAGEGPCLAAAKSTEVIRVSVTDAEHRWPNFAGAAATLGVTSYLSAPLFVDQEYHGSLNLYAEQDHGFCRLDAALLELYTTAAEAALANARRYLRSREHIAQLRTALTSRAVIDQAKGIIMAVHLVSAEEAFKLLIRRSQRENIKLRDLAARFVDEASSSDT